MLFRDGFAKVQRGSKIYKATEKDLKNYEVRSKSEATTSTYETTSNFLVSSNSGSAKTANTKTSTEPSNLDYLTYHMYTTKF